MSFLSLAYKIWLVGMSIDVKTLLEEKDVRVWTYGKNCSPGWVNIRCPFCNDHSNHLGINLESNAIRCWKCGEDGDFYKLLIELFDIDFREARMMAAPYQDYHYEPTSKRLPPISRQPGTPILPKEATKEMPPEYQKYLISRRFDPDYVHEKYDLYYCNFIGNFKGRIIVPVKINNEIVSFVGMSIHREVPNILKYKNCPDIQSIVPRRNLVYNIDNVLVNVNKIIIIIVEGILDCWRMGDNCVAIMTTSFTQEQINLLTDKADEFFIMFDSKKKDPTAPRKARQLSKQLVSLGKRVKILNLDKGDPDDLDTIQVELLRQQLGM